MFWGASVDALYRDHIFLQLDLDPIDVQPSYWQLNAGLRFGLADNGLTLNLVGQNLTDEVVMTEANDVPVLAGAHWGRADVGRTWVASLRLSW